MGYVIKGGLISCFTHLENSWSCLTQYNVDLVNWKVAKLTISVHFIESNMHGVCQNYY